MWDERPLALVLALVAAVALAELLRRLSARVRRRRRSATFVRFDDEFASIEEVTAALRRAGLESSNLIVGVDFTASNRTSGQHTFGGRSLHDTRSLNPYQQAISIVGRTLAEFDDDNLIPAFGFGDATTRDQRVFPFFDSRPCRGFEEVLARYTEITRHVELAGPTSFAPLIRQATAIVAEERAFHILLILADGQVDNPEETAAAIVEAANHPLSIVVVGVGDGPWDVMKRFDDKLPRRRFDNLQLVIFNEVISQGEGAFATAALMEVPQQYAAIRALGYL